MNAQQTPPWESPSNLLALPLFDTGSQQAAVPGTQHLFQQINADQATVASPGMPAAQTTSQRLPGAVGMMNWSEVNALRAKVGELLVKELDGTVALPAEERESRGWKIIIDVVREHADEQIRIGQPAWSAVRVDQVQRAVFDAMFRLGRIQPLVDLPDVENVMIFGHDKVFLDYGSGRIEPADPVADSDDELIEQIQFLANRDGERGRPFSSVAWELRLTLPGGERLQATHPPITPRPHVVIRRHPLHSITLEQLVSRGTLTPAMREFLSAAVKARKSIVVSGQQGTGKTTLVRALAHEMDPLEHIVTIESERELHLDRSGLHHMVTAFEARPGQGELNVDGSRAGEVSLDELIVSSLRHNTQRIIVGEVRGPEVAAMTQAMQAGAGSMSTIHTNTPAETIERLAVLLASSAMSASADFGYRLIEQHIDFIVQLTNTGADGTRIGTRYVSDIVEVVPGDGPGGGVRPICQPIFKAARGSTRAVVAGSPKPQTLADLEDVGFISEKHQMSGASR